MLSTWIEAEPNVPRSYNWMSTSETVDDLIKSYARLPQKCSKTGLPCRNRVLFADISKFSNFDSSVTLTEAAKKMKMTMKKETRDKRKQEK